MFFKESLFLFSGGAEVRLRAETICDSSSFTFLTECVFVGFRPAENKIWNIQANKIYSLVH